MQTDIQLCFLLDLHYRVVLLFSALPYLAAPAPIRNATHSKQHY